MKHKFDIAIVSDTSLCQRAKNAPENSKPFYNQFNDLNIQYKFMIEAFTKYGLRATLATIDDVFADNIESSWIYENKWIPIKEQTRSNSILLRYPIKGEDHLKQIKSLQSSYEIVGTLELFDTLSDKYKTYELLPEYCIPTVKVSTNPSENIDCLLQKIKGEKDFDKNKLVVKSTKSFGGKDVSAISLNPKELESIVNSNRKTEYIIQAFVKNLKKIKGADSVPYDLRLVFLNEEIIQSFYRFSKPGEFRCNYHLGGSMKYISNEDIPEVVLEKANEIDSKFKDCTFRNYSLDFFVGESEKVYLIEANGMSGFVFGNDYYTKYSHEKIDLLVKKIIER